MEIENEIDYIRHEDMRPGECVLVEFVVRNNKLNFIATIIQNDKEVKEFNLCFLRKVGNSNQIYQRNDNDMSWEPYTKVLTKKLDFVINSRNHFIFKKELVNVV